MAKGGILLMAEIGILYLTIYISKQYPELKVVQESAISILSRFLLLPSTVNSGRGSIEHSLLKSGSELYTHVEKYGTLS